MVTPTIIEYYDLRNSVCSFWRGRGPLSELLREGYINLIEGTWNDEWDTLRCANIAFFQRPMSKDCLNQVAMCKDLGLKIWIDLDDSSDIPPHHEVYNLWMEKYDEKTFFKIMLLADVVTVSTKYLQDYYLKFSNKVVVLPNAINDYWLKFKSISQNKLICWRGGSHHLTDLYEYKDEIIEVMNSHSDWKLVCIGSEAKFLSDKLSNYEYAGDFNIHNYFAYILQNNPSIFVVPLCDNELNRGKSSISWQEATLCGAVSLTPSYWGLRELSNPYNSKKQFRDELERLIVDDSLRFNLHYKSKCKIEDKFVLSKVNKQRLNIIKDLMI
jgi:hypothetical protein